ncbi:MAG: DUF6443 domain-containing protein, partial [Mediterranea sp.]|nr:DUF6443 domain-containing protein [Mediterranea sp.]
MNYRTRIIPRKEVSTIWCGENSGRLIVDWAEGNTSDAAVETQYLDGFGRPLLLVRRGASPAMTDRYELVEYDFLGRVSRSWLPGSNGETKGSYEDPNEVMRTVKFYNDDQKPYVRNVYYDEPGSELAKQYGAGSDWQDTGHGVTFEYLCNIEGNAELDCALYSVSYTSESEDLIVVKRAGSYPTGTLSVTKVTDEDGDVSLEFRNRSGLTVLARRIGERGERHDTYSLYDAFGRIQAVLPPLVASGIESGGDTGEILRQYAYLYRYDPLGQPIAKKLPGADWIHYVYNKAGQPVFTQDGNQRARNPDEWTFSLSDPLGRQVLTGTCVRPMDYAKSPCLDVTVKAVPTHSGTGMMGYNVE